MPLSALGDSELEGIAGHAGERGLSFNLSWVRFAAYARPSMTVLLTDNIAAVAISSCIVSRCFA
jgi:hypothetical protein